MEETVPKSARPRGKVPVPSPGGEDGKQSVVGVGGVVNDAVSLPQASFVVDVFDDGKRCSGDALGSFHYPLQLLPVMGCAITIPGCNTVCEDALNSTPVEVLQDLRRQMGFP